MLETLVVDIACHELAGPVAYFSPDLYAGVRRTDGPRRPLRQHRQSRVDVRPHAGAAPQRRQRGRVYAPSAGQVFITKEGGRASRPLNMKKQIASVLWSRRR